MQVSLLQQEVSQGVHSKFGDLIKGINHIAFTLGHLKCRITTYNTPSNLSPIPLVSFPEFIPPKILHYASNLWLLLLLSSEWRWYKLYLHLWMYDRWRKCYSSNMGYTLTAPSRHHGHWKHVATIKSTCSNALLCKILSKLFIRLGGINCQNARQPNQCIVSCPDAHAPAPHPVKECLVF